ncbi:S1C family serine protease [Nocardioides sp. URHA0020]|uniref:S1C family serine protease n=1 Tax=Nocardioides sp. URHA0020 TaxID=1380392 RepID=UPI000687AD7B|nr:trypsin-like peptidase domain-containing protein [Nocardioides sp. URHA0020]
MPDRVRRWWWPTSVAVAAVLGCAVGALVVVATQDDDPLSACPATTVARDVLPSVVTISVATPEGSGGNGTGAIVRDGGYILTNEHVISAAVDGGGRLSVHYSNGETSPATLVGADFTTDLAVIRADDGGYHRPLLEHGDSDAVRVGQPVVALGAPLGLSNTVTAGIVSALGRYVPIPADTGEVAHLLDAIQTDASINPGNSGGPLVDCTGAQVGVNSAISTVPSADGVAGGGSVGLGFAIPMSIADPIADQLIETGRVAHPVLGLGARAVDDDPTDVPSGLEVTAVVPGGPAAGAGLAVGDLITEIDGDPAQHTEQLVLVSLRGEVGDTVAITYLRAGDRRSTELTLAAPR